MNDMNVAYKIVTRRARASAENAEEVEQWAIDHDNAMSAWAVNGLYQECVTLFQFLARLEELARKKDEESWLGSPSRTDALKKVLRAFRAVRRLCEKVGVDNYDDEASCHKVDQLIGVTTAMLKGVGVFDSEAHMDAIAEAKRGEAVSIDELRRSLRDRHS